MTIAGNLFLAPLAGISNRPFRLLAREGGAAMCYTEMISADAITRGQKRTLAMIDLDPDEHPVGVQLFGADPEIMARAVAKTIEFGPDLIDLNLGCPVKKVIRKNGGAALLKDLVRAEELMLAAAENSPVPVTIKIRTGWDTARDVFLEMGHLAEKCGLGAVTLHARSRSQNYSTKSDWSKIGALKKEISIPVIGNGDIRTPLDAEGMFRQTECDAIMIGRAAMGNPYIFRPIKDYLERRKMPPEESLEDKINLALKHARLVIETWGELRGATMMRKHLAWYTRGFPDGAGLRKKLMHVTGYHEMVRVFDQYRKEISPDVN